MHHNPSNMSTPPTGIAGSSRLKAITEHVATQYWCWHAVANLILDEVTPRSKTLQEPSLQDEYLCVPAKPTKKVQQQFC